MHDLRNAQLILKVGLLIRSGYLLRRDMQLVLLFSRGAAACSIFCSLGSPEYSVMVQVAYNSKNDDHYLQVTQLRALFVLRKP